MAGKTVKTEAQRPAEQRRRCTALVTHNFRNRPPSFPCSAWPDCARQRPPRGISPQLHRPGQQAVPAAPLPSPDPAQLLAFRD